MKQQDYSISDWIDEKVMRGYYTFTIEDVKKNFPQFGDAYVRTSLSPNYKEENYFSLERVLCYYAN